MDLVAEYEAADISKPSDLLAQPVQKHADTLFSAIRAGNHARFFSLLGVLSNVTAPPEDQEESKDDYSEWYHKQEFLDKLKVCTYLHTPIGGNLMHAAMRRYIEKDDTRFV